jgi:hypothetical protein
VSTEQDRGQSALHPAQAVSTTSPKDGHAERGGAIALMIDLSTFVEQGPLTDPQASSMFAENLSACPRPPRDGSHKIVWVAIGDKMRT